MEVKTQTFNVKALMKETIETSDLTKSSDIAEEILEQIPPKHYREALRQILPIAVTQALGSSGQYPITTNKVQAILNGAKPVGTKLSPSANSANSAKNALIKKWVKRMSENIAMNPEGTLRKRLSECSFDDLMAAAQIRYDQALSMQLRADEYRSFADLVKEYNVDKFGDLPQNVLEKILSND